MDEDAETTKTRLGVIVDIIVIIITIGEIMGNRRKTSRRDGRGRR